MVDFPADHGGIRAVAGVNDKRGTGRNRPHRQKARRIRHAGCQKNLVRAANFCGTDRDGAPAQGRLPSGRAGRPLIVEPQGPTARADGAPGFIGRDLVVGNGHIIAAIPYPIIGLIA